MTEPVWFVGSNPSFRNTNPKVPFYGTRSLLNLLSWIAYIDIPKYDMVNVSEKIAKYNTVKPTKEDYARLKRTLDNKKYVVALGFVASKALTKLGISHYKLPHPSPANRLLNDPILMEKELSKCGEYLRNIQK